MYNKFCDRMQEAIVPELSDFPRIYCPLIRQTFPVDALVSV